MIFYGTLDGSNNRSKIAMAAFMVAASVGAIWWGGLMTACGQVDQLSLLAEAEFYDLRQTYGLLSPGELFLFEVAGPLTCPARLGGPFLLTGWNYVLCLLSTGGNLLLLTWIGHLSRRMLVGNGPTLRRALPVVGVLLLYVAPVIVRATVKLLQRGSG
jgi:hypothetical protein